MYEVMFRGEHEKSLLVWRPLDEKKFGCSKKRARKRFAFLVQAGLDGRQVDGVIPHVVEVSKVRRWMRKEGIATRRDEMLSQTVEPNAWQNGPWADNANYVPDETLGLLDAEPENDDAPGSDAQPSGIAAEARTLAS